MIPYIIAQTPNVPFDGWIEILKFGPAFTAMAAFLAYVISVNKDQKEELRESKKSSDELTKQVITAINSASYVMENAPATLKIHVRDAIREESAVTRTDLENILKK